MDWPGVPRIILTPNIMEFKRLCETMASIQALWYQQQAR
jgi:ATP-dependent NAD(P)H-hydrate dehydratase